VILLLGGQMALVAESGWLEIIMKQKASHLLLIRTNLGYGNVLTAACARQGCSASGLVWFFFFWLAHSGDTGSNIVSAVDHPEKLSLFIVTLTEYRKKILPSNRPQQPPP
jgi:hypothetical protein